MSFRPKRSAVEKSQPIKITKRNILAFYFLCFSKKSILLLTENVAKKYDIVYN